MEESNYLPPPVILMASGLQPPDRIIRRIESEGLIGLGRFGSAVFDDFTNEIYECRGLKPPVHVVGQADAV